MRWNEDVDTLQCQVIICEAGAFFTGFRVVEFAVPKGATNGSEADDFFCVRVHVNDYHWKEE